MSTNCAALRHFLASLAYHATKAIKDAPENYPELDIGKGVRTPQYLLHHITGVLSYADSFYKPYETTYFPMRSWSQEVESFYAVLKSLDESLETKTPNKVSEFQILQGPFSDAMAHIGQLLMMRRLAGAPVPAENFIYADIRAGVVGPEQPDPVAPDK